MYNSMINPDAQTMYTCKIEDGGESPRVSIYYYENVDYVYIMRTYVSPEFITHLSHSINPHYSL